MGTGAVDGGPLTAPRHVLDNLFTATECDELVLIARALGVVGYREYVSSVTLFEACSTPACLLKMVAARERVRAAVEEAFRMPLLVEFTGLLCWRPGASIAWHTDANRPYLRQREVAAVVYLNAAGADFSGGELRFGDGSPAEVVPRPGRLVAYSAQERHSVRAVGCGERFALTMWFTSDPAHDEDLKLLPHLAGPGGGAPPRALPASLYALADGVDLRLCRLALMGFGLAVGGRLLRSADDAPEGAALQLVLNRGLLAARRQPAGGAAPAARALLPTAVEFAGVHHASCSLHRWAQQSRAPQPVCCRHLSDGVASSWQHCGWLDSEGCCPPTEPGPSPIDLQAVAKAAAEWEAEAQLDWNAQQAAARGWQGLGALYWPP